jgi:hypothetical protein
MFVPYVPNLVIISLPPKSASLANVDRCRCRTYRFFFMLYVFIIKVDLNREYAKKKRNINMIRCVDYANC